MLGSNSCLWFLMWSFLRLIWIIFFFIFSVTTPYEYDFFNHLYFYLVWEWLIQFWWNIFLYRIWFVMNSIFDRSVWFCEIVCWKYFQVSCGRVFAPGLGCMPVAVIPNSGGCIVARSFEAKTFVIDGGGPAFLWKEAVLGMSWEFFSNFDLNAGNCRRVWRT